jgi:hypothetical protein
MVHDISDDRQADTEPKPPAEIDQLARQEAIKQIGPASSSPWWARRAAARRRS